ncbi:MAG: DUF1934 domain-containing protein [Eubacterium sp.]|nr:DUF1934 domain-containing protein [Eubacterium sp.]
MTKDVLLKISGLHIGPDEVLQDGEAIEIITPAQYYFKNGKHYVLYDEVGENKNEITKNTLKFYDKYLSVTKTGYTNVQMIIEENKENITSYQTPMGALQVALQGKNIVVDEKENNIMLSANYGLAINFEHVADCRISMNIQSKDSRLNLG